MEMMKSRLMGLLLLLVLAGSAYASPRYESEFQQDLPETAELKDERGSMQLYVNLDVEGEDGEENMYSFWLRDKQTGDVTWLFAANNAAEPRWNDMKDGNGIRVSKEEIAVGEVTNVRFLPWDSGKIFLEGCPDGRNIWSYLYDVEDETAIQFPSTEGLQGMDVNARVLYLGSYRYHPEGGRYSVVRGYSTDGVYMGEERLASEDDE